MIDRPYVNTLYKSDRWLVRRDDRIGVITIGDYNENIQGYFTFCTIILNDNKIHFSTGYSIKDLPENIRNIVLKNYL